MATARARRGIKRGPSEGNRHRLLDLTSAYRALAPDDSAGFARPGPPPAEPLPLKFTCRACQREVPPDAASCPFCRDKFWQQTPRTRDNPPDR